MAPLPHLSLELICMILVQLMLVDPPRIFHLRRFREFGLFDHVEFHGKMHITQPLVTRLSPWFRNWAKKYYAFVFASSTDPSNPRLGGFWIRRHIDLVYIDKAFCDFELLLLTKIRFANVSQIAVDATLLNGTTGGTDWRCRRFVSVMDQLLSCFPNVENMVFMAPTRPNPPRNRYPGLRLVDEEEEECQKHLPFTNFYHCGAIVTNVAHTHILLSRSPDAISGPLIRTRRLHERDNLRKSLVRGCPMKVILFQRQGMPAPTKNIVTGPKRSINSALSKIASRMRPVPISLLELPSLVEGSKTNAGPSRARAQVSSANLRPSQVKTRIW